MLRSSGIVARKPRLEAPEDSVIYELHVRDFSMHDESVPAALRGTFKAFALPTSRGIRHLRKLSNAGLSHVHLLPAFDCATIPEDRSTHADPGNLSAYAPDSEEQQAAIEPIRDQCLGFRSSSARSTICVRRLSCDRLSE